MAQEISIQFTRFSAFYSPLIATFAAGFLEKEGLRARHSVAAAGKSAIAGLVEAFRKGAGEYVHLQGAAPQQLEHDGAGHIVAALGEAIGPCALSSLAARGTRTGRSPRRP